MLQLGLLTRALECGILVLVILLRDLMVSMVTKTASTLLPLDQMAKLW